MAARSKLGAGLTSILLLIALGVATSGHVLDRTLLRADFVADQLERIDLPAIVSAHIIANLDHQTKDFWPPIEKTFLENRAELMQVVRAGLRSCFDYFRGRTGRLNFSLRIQHLKEDFEGRFHAYLREYPPPEVRALSEEAREKALQKIEHDFLQQVGLPDVFVVDDQKMSADIVDDLRDIRSGFRGILWGYRCSLVAVLALAVALVRIVSLRWLSVVLAGYGAGLGMAGLVLRMAPVVSLVADAIDLPVSAEEHFEAVVRSFTEPFIAVSAGCCVAGLVIWGIAGIGERGRGARGAE